MVFSLLHLVMREEATEWIERVSIYSHGFMNSVDLEIAEEVLCASESALPHAQHWRRFFSIFPGSGLAELPLRDPLHLWWSRCGGIYSPNYLTSVQPAPSLICLGGGGGGGVRSFYSKYFQIPELFAASCERRIHLQEYSEWLHDQIIEAFAALAPDRKKKLT